MGVEGWRKQKLGRLATFSKGSGYSKKDLRVSGTPIILYGRLYTNYELVIKHVNTFVEDKGSSLYSRGGEVVVPASGETAEDISRASVISDSGVIIGGDLNVIYPNNEICPELLALLISSGDTKKSLSSRAQGKTVVHLHRHDLEFLEIAYPQDVNEQRKIVEAFSDIDLLIVDLQRKIQKKKDIRKGSLQLLLKDDLKYQWVECPITDLLKPGGIKIGPFGSQLKKEMLLTDGLYKVYGQENVYENDFSIGDRFLTPDHFQRLKSCEILPGDFLMSTMGTIGKCAIAPQIIQNGIMDSHLIRLRFDEKKINQEYVLHLFSDQFDYLQRQTQQLSVGGIMEGLSVGIVSKLKVKYPNSIKDQNELISIFNDMNCEIRKLEEKLSKYRKVKQGMMEELLTGKVRLV